MTFVTQSHIVCYDIGTNTALETLLSPDVQKLPLFYQNTAFEYLESGPYYWHQNDDRFFVYENTGNELIQNWTVKHSYYAFKTKFRQTAIESPTKLLYTHCKYYNLGTCVCFPEVSPRDGLCQTATLTINHQHCFIIDTVVATDCALCYPGYRLKNGACEVYDCTSKIGCIYCQFNINFSASTEC